LVCVDVVARVVVRRVLAAVRVVLRVARAPALAGFRRVVLRLLVVAGFAEPEVLVAILSAPVSQIDRTCVCTREVSARYSGRE
jgi:hypothetical protein